MNIAIVPAGQWGSAVSVPFLDNTHTVTFWFRTEEASALFTSTRENSRLPGIIFPAAVQATANLAQVVKEADIVVIACTSQHVRKLAGQIKPHLKPTAIILSITKGIEVATHLRLSQVIGEVLPEHLDQIAVLSGPNFAQEVAGHLPAATVVASQNGATATLVQQAITTPYFKAYTSPDLIGVELAGALKNSIAIAAGMCDGLQMGDNARAALVTRGFGEIVRLSVAIGALPQTLYGLAGIGDLLLTTTGSQSRNHRFGMNLVQNPELAEAALQESTVEGYFAITAALALAAEYKIELPLITKLNQVITREISVHEAGAQIMESTYKSEF